MNNADKSGSVDPVGTETVPSPATENSTVPAVESAPKPKRVRKPKTVTSVSTKTDAAVAFRTAFPKTSTVPAWLGMVDAIRAIHAAVPADKRASYDAVLSVARRIIVRPDVGHAFTFGSGRDIAQTQNVIYIAFALSGIPRSDVPDAFGAAIWRAVLGKTQCEYRDHVDYFASTGSACIGRRHNDAFGLSAGSIAPIVNRWFNPAKS